MRSFVGWLLHKRIELLNLFIAVMGGSWNKLKYRGFNRCYAKYVRRIVITDGGEGSEGPPLLMALILN